MEAHDLKAFLQSHGYVEDRWGHFKKEITKTTIDKVSEATKTETVLHRYKMQKTSVRHEVQLGEGNNKFWHKRWSEYYCNIEINENNKIARKKELAEEIKIPEGGN